MREVKRQKEKVKRAGGELRKRTPALLVKMSAIRVWNLCSSVPVCGPNPVFKIKNPSQNVRKVGKPMQGKASVLTPPPGGPPSYRPKPPVWERKILYFQPLYPFSALSMGSFLTPKNLQIMTNFLQRQFVNKSQNNLVSRLDVILTAPWVVSHPTPYAINHHCRPLPAIASLPTKQTYQA
jgi:hypothetical protein